MASRGGISAGQLLGSIGPIVLVVVVLGPSMRAGTLPDELVPAGAPSSVVVLTAGMASANESPACASLETNASLAASYSQAYQGIGVGFGNYRDANGSPPLNQSAYPDPTVGANELVTAWTTICDSPAFTRLYSAWGVERFGAGSALEANGHYTFQYGFNYPANCTGIYAPATNCENDTEWTVDLVNGGVSGPTTSESPPPVGPPIASIQGEPNGPSALPPLGVNPATTVAGLAAAVALIAGAGILTERRLGRPPR